ncbi:basic amino acid/polyamine antiporter [Limosilactobacillus sp.]|uniref:basic amino acid/polyamine antiporter n=1 Tax=Limosilactobacillus sp. TaxID=2773925 RepID=UPI0025C3D883|nr:basic amino acid/polyamine antiporter [Limosilactobacillus sp.]MCH3921435.1 basic amino acid/polyamine antiporter [Limosilactobacillus sp.]MCH3928206.1 basic amino acid/polyamine antiporter [Limosilactobacillus sp.]
MNEKKGITATELTLLIVGSTIGSGAFGITSDLATAAAPGPAMIAWVIVGIGVLMLVLSLNNLSQKRPDLESGIFSYAGAAFGPLGEFISGWAYWLSAWLGNIAFATITMSALGTFFPKVFKNGQNLTSIIIAIILTWILTFLVNQGIESAAFINSIGTICKIVPLIVFVICVILGFKARIFTADFWGNVAQNIKGGPTSVFSQVKSSIIVMMWLFVGVEGASVLTSRARSRSDAEKASIMGLVSLLTIYIVVSVLPYGVMSRAELAAGGQPALGAIMQHLVGNWGAALISIGLIISVLVSWLSWTMLPAESLMLMADDQTLPSSWGKVNAKKAPTRALVITGVLQSLFLFSLLFTSYAYNFAYTLCTAAILISYLLVGIYQMMYSWEHQDWGQFTIGLIATLFELMAMVLSGWKQVMIVSVGFIPGFIFYLQAAKEYHHAVSAKEKWAMVLIAIFAIISLVLVANGTISIN